jgi:CRP-like cAMP-binding protein
MSVKGVFTNAQKTLTVPAGDVVFREGEAGTDMYGVIDGEIELRSAGDLVYSVGPGEIFGEMALVDHSPRSANATATSDTTLAVIDRRLFLFLITETPTFALEVMSTMAGRLRAYD